MKAHLMYEDQDFNLKQMLPGNEKDLVHDLELDTLLSDMATKDDFIFTVAKKAILCGLNDLDAIRYRQDILRDCLKNPAVLREIYQIPLDSIFNKRKRWLGILTSYPGAVLSSAVEMMNMFVGLLKRLKRIADDHAEDFQSAGFTTFLSMIRRELDDAYFLQVEEHLRELKFKHGVLISAELGRANEPKNYVLRRPNPKNGKWWKEIINLPNPVFSFYISDRDEAGARALSEIKDQGINLVANALAQSADHIDSFLEMLRAELAFYIGCLNLYEKLAQDGNPITFPNPIQADERKHSFKGLYDACLALTMRQKVVGNDASADGKDLVIITGANQGGKSTFLRSIGLAQLMMQAGMYVPAEEFSANLCRGVFTHYKRKEDASMNSGKLDEELGRMSDIVDAISSNSLLLFNESFAATNELEGSEIARQITNALLNRSCKVFFVTHMYDFAHSFFVKRREDGFFLRAERKEDGTRTFKLIAGEPLQTSFGEDVYRVVFGQNGSEKAIESPVAVNLPESK